MFRVNRKRSIVYEKRSSIFWLKPIVLIAFVVVAAYSYVMLGAGFFATQKSQEVTTGMKQATSNLILDGMIMDHIREVYRHCISM